MTFSLDFSNDKPDIRELIPAGTPVLVKFTYAPGGADLPGTPNETREGALTKAKEPSDAYYLKGEFTVQRGPYKGRKFWGNLTVAGGKVDEKGKSIAAGITRKNIRAILDSSQGLRSDDESADAMAKRVIRGLRDLQGRQFFCKVAVEKGTGGYADKNGLGTILTPGMTKDTPTTIEGFLALVDNPPVSDAPAAKAAAPAPAWGAATQAPASPTAAGFVAPNTGAVAGLAAFSATVQNVQPTPAAQADNVPAWARSAA
jgi:hypothetical protein